MREALRAEESAAGTKLQLSRAAMQLYAIQQKEARVRLSEAEREVGAVRESLHSEGIPEESLSDTSDSDTDNDVIHSNGS